MNNLDIDEILQTFTYSTGVLDNDLSWYVCEQTYIPADDDDPHPKEDCFTFRYTDVPEPNETTADPYPYFSLEEIAAHKVFGSGLHIFQSDGRYTDIAKTRE